MKLSRKIMSLLAIGVLSIYLVACSSEQPKENITRNDQTKQEQSNTNNTNEIDASKESKLEKYEISEDFIKATVEGIHLQHLRYKL